MNTTKLRATNLVRELRDLIQEIHDSGDCGNMLSDVLEMVDKLCSKAYDKSQVRITDEMISRAMSVVIGYSGEHGTHNDYLSKDSAREVLEAALLNTPELINKDMAKLETHNVSLGVGDGHGKLFVYGDYDSIKAVQEKIFELEELRTKLAVLESQRPHWAKGYSTDSIAAQVSGGTLSELWELLGVSNQTDAVEKLQRMAEIESQEPVAWGAFYSGGKYSGQLHRFDSSEDRIDRYISIVHGSHATLTLRKRPLYTKPVPADKPERITEQDAREIAESCLAYWLYKHPMEFHVGDWLSTRGRELLNKLNADREQVLDDASAQKLWDYYQTLLKHYGFDGITDLLVKYRKLAEQVPADKEKNHEPD